ncbi:hypothetical protein FM104_04105 [Microbacterium esteraromaticum]|uniref:Uncharacterized protein n=1 Tax=Microbacterium esteraromaticum TaxID=57043 RepID=A0A1R4IV75_9MICO|nr:hypothetical protein [Microbacterium esteraromaticum]SJN23614.1 hypothetical protein FM104_04105 [Microbacterium esteraromaticum]
MDDTTALIPGAHRGIRHLDGRESAFAGELVTDGEQMRVRVDAAGTSDTLWTHASAEHVAGVRDVVRRRDGLDALLPWCVEPVEAFLGRRATAQRPLSAGETVTLVGSMLRGVFEVEDSDVRGRWWLTDESRPVFVPGEGSSCAASTGEIVGRIRGACTDRALERLLGEIGSATADRRVVLRSTDTWERELTELASPRALEREVYPPERVAAIPLHRARMPEDTQLLAERRGLRQLAVELGGELLERVRERMPRHRPPRNHSETARKSKTDAGAGRTAPEKAGRGRMLLVGAAAAAVVLLGGLLWPGGGEDSSAMEDTRSTDSAAQSAQTGAGLEPTTEPKNAPQQTPKSEVPASAPETPAEREPDPAPHDDDDLVDGSVQQIVTVLLAGIADCAAHEDMRCAQAVVDGAGEIVLERLARSPEGRKIIPIEDYGDIAVVRLVSTAEQGEQMLVLSRQNEKWLVRDVYDVVDQPPAQG